MYLQINQFRNGGTIGYDPENEETWKIIITRPGGEKIVPSILQCLSRLKKLGRIHGCSFLYADYVVLYNRTGTEINPDVLQLIALLGNHYGNDALEVEVWFNMLYAVMVAGEKQNSDNRDKRLKRLCLHHVLVDGVEPEVAINFSKGILWQNLDRLMKAKGF